MLKMTKTSIIMGAKEEVRFVTWETTVPYPFPTRSQHCMMMNIPLNLNLIVTVTMNLP